MIDKEIIKDTAGAVIGFGTFAVKKGVDTVANGFDWEHFNQEVVEDITGALISVTVGFFLMKLWRNLFPDKKKEDGNTGN